MILINIICREVTQIKLITETPYWCARLLLDSGAEKPVELPKTDRQKGVISRRIRV
jgi:hypothetical protein